MNHYKNTFFLILICICLPVFLWGCTTEKKAESVAQTTEKVISESSDKNEPVTIELFAMDTYMTLTAYGNHAKEALDKAAESIKRIDELLSTGNPDSEIAMLNRDKKRTVSLETYNLICRSKEFYEETEGIFDISVYPIMQAWGFTDENYRVPSGEELKSLLTHVHADMIHCSDGGKIVTLEDPDMEIDLGGIAKGYASDIVTNILRDQGVEHAVINLGGNVKTLGSKPDGSEWRVGIADPSNDSSYVGGVLMKDKAAITSGGYQRYFEEDGKTYIHIIDLSTGDPARTGLGSVTIIAEDGTMADAMSTSLFIMGREKAAEYWREHADFFDVVFIEDDGSVWITEGIKDSYFSERDFRVIEK